MFIGIIISERIPLHPSTIHRVVVAEIVVDEGEFGVVKLTAPLDGLGDIVRRRSVGALAWQAVG